MNPSRALIHLLCVAALAGCSNAAPSGWEGVRQYLFGGGAAQSSPSRTAEEPPTQGVTGDVVKTPPVTAASLRSEGKTGLGVGMFPIPLPHAPLSLYLFADFNISPSFQIHSNVHFYSDPGDPYAIGADDLQTSTLSKWITFALRKFMTPEGLFIGLGSGFGAITHEIRFESDDTIGDSTARVIPLFVEVGLLAGGSTYLEVSLAYGYPIAVSERDNSGRFASATKQKQAQDSFEMAKIYTRIMIGIGWHFF